MPEIVVKDTLIHDSSYRFGKGGHKDDTGQLSMLGTEKSNIEDHAPIIARKEFVQTRHGGYEVWSSGCICGWQSRSPGYIIPCNTSAEAIWERHLKIETGIVLESPEWSIDEEYEQLSFALGNSA